MKKIKETIKFKNGYCEYEVDPINKEVTITKDSEVVSRLDVGSLVWLINKYKSILDEFDKVEEPEEFYSNQFNNEKVVLDVLVHIYNDITDKPKIFKKTEEFVSKYYKYGEGTVFDFITRLIAGNYSFEDLEEIVDCDYLSVEVEDRQKPPFEYLVPYTIDPCRHFFEENLTEENIKVLVTYDEKQLDEFNHKYGFHIKHYNEYLKEVRDENS